MADPRTSLDLKKLFRDPDMFESSDHWGDAGFEIVRSSESKIMVASHEQAKGYLFKKYCDDISLDDQHENYLRRLDGIGKVRELIDEHQLQRIVAPQKWIHELPSAFSHKKQKSHVLIVERLPILNKEDTESAYRDIDKKTLGELCVVLHSFRGLDSNAKNVPFTKDGKIAFIDTEHWDRHSKKKYKQRKRLKYIREFLSDDRRKFAKKVFEGLGSDYDDDDDDDDDDDS